MQPRGFYLTNSDSQNLESSILSASPTAGMDPPSENSKNIAPQSNRDCGKQTTRTGLIIETKLSWIVFS